MRLIPVWGKAWTVALTLMSICIWFKRQTHLCTYPVTSATHTDPAQGPLPPLIGWFPRTRHPQNNASLGALMGPAVHAEKLLFASEWIPLLLFNYIVIFYTINNLLEQRGVNLDVKNLSSTLNGETGNWAPKQRLKKGTSHHPEKQSRKHKANSKNYNNAKLIQELLVYIRLNRIHFEAGISHY